MHKKWMNGSSNFIDPLHFQIHRTVMDFWNNLRRIEWRACLNRLAPKAVVTPKSLRVLWWRWAGWDSVVVGNGCHFGMRHPWVPRRFLFGLQRFDPVISRLATKHPMHSSRRGSGAGKSHTNTRWWLLSNLCGERTRMGIRNHGSCCCCCKWSLGDCQPWRLSSRHVPVCGNGLPWRRAGTTTSKWWLEARRRQLSAWQVGACYRQWHR